MPSANASRGARAPLPIAGASLTQSGGQLVWQVTLAAPFSPRALKGDRRSLCLLFARAHTRRVTGQLCVTGPRRGGRTARVAYEPISATGPGKAKVIAAAVSRTGSHELTASFAPAAIGASYRPLRWQVRSALTGRRCAPPVHEAQCALLYPASPQLIALHAPRLVGCTLTRPGLVYDAPRSGREIALTFDDGPWYQTPQFVALLARYSVPATFFEIGEQIATYGQKGAVLRRMLASGDMIGDHTWSHPDVAGAGTFARDQIESAAAAIRTATGGFEPCLFRAPYGEISPALVAEARSLGFATIQWDIDPRDWAGPGVAAIESNVIGNARPGAIVELHDGGGDRAQTLAALPDIITTLRSRGYRFVTVTQLLGARLIYR